MQRWCLVADLHSGSPVGLTPTPTNPVQAGLLNRYIDAILWFGDRPDVLLCLGDPTEGVDPKLDIDDYSIVSQFTKSAELLAMWKPKRKYVVITGTKTHTHVQNQELEGVLISMIKQKHWDLYREETEVEIFRKFNTWINGWFNLSCRHHINSSMIPHGRATAALRAKLWSILNAALKAQLEKTELSYPHLIVFGHTHYYMYVEDAWSAAMILGSWKGLGDKYGDEICTGSVQLSATKLTIHDTENEGWEQRTRRYYAGVVSRMENN